MPQKVECNVEKQRLLPNWASVSARAHDTCPDCAPVWVYSHPVLCPCCFWKFCHKYNAAKGLWLVPVVNEVLVLSLFNYPAWSVWCDTVRVRALMWLIWLQVLVHSHWPSMARRASQCEPGQPSKPGSTWDRDPEKMQGAWPHRWFKWGRECRCTMVHSRADPSDRQCPVGGEDNNDSLWLFFSLKERGLTVGKPLIHENNIQYLLSRLQVL